MAGPFKPVGVDADSLFPPRVENRLQNDIKEGARDAVGAALQVQAPLSKAVNDAGDTITVSVDSGQLAEIIRDTMAAALVAGTGVTITPNDGADSITIAVTGAGGGDVYLNYDVTGATNAAPVIQAAYDAGASSLTLKPGSVCYLNSAVFFDSTSTTRKFTINMNGARFRLGPNLPTTSAFWFDTTTRWAFFPNTLRSALSGGVVTVSDATMAATPWGAKGGLAIHDGTVEGQLANNGLVFYNTVPTHISGVIMYQSRFLLSGRGYVDGNTLRDCRSLNASVNNSFLYCQIDNGDGVSIDSCTGDAADGLIYLYLCRGANINGTVGGQIRLENCTAITMSGPHHEASEWPRTRTPILIQGSTVVIEGAEMWKDTNSGGRWAAITVNDNGSERTSRVVVRDSNASTYFAAGTGADPAAGPFLSIEAMAMTGEIIFERVTPQIFLQPLAQPFKGGTIGVTSSVSAIQSALTAGVNLVESGSFRLYANSGSTWVVDPIGPAGAVLSFARGQLGQPLVWAGDSAAGPDSITGQLVNGTKYAYTWAALDEFGRYGQRATANFLTMNGSGCCRLYGNPPRGGRVVVWRASGATAESDVYAAATHYAVLDVGPGTARMYDRGANINGVPWVTTSVPQPNTVANPGTSVSEFRVNNSPVIVPPAVVLTDGATVATDASLSNLFRLTVAGDRTLLAPTNPKDAQRAQWSVFASGANRTLTLQTGVAGGFAFGTTVTSVPVITSNTTTVIEAVYSAAAARWRVLSVVAGF